MATPLNQLVQRCFERVAALVASPMLLVERSGAVLAGNTSAAAVFAGSRPLAGAWLQELVAEDAAAAVAYLEACADSDTPLAGAFSLRREGGRVAACRCEGIAFPAEGANQPLVLLIFHAGAGEERRAAERRIDVLSEELDESRRGEEGLRAAQERFRRAQQAAHLGTWDWDLRSGRLVSDGLEVVYGRPPAALEGSQELLTRDVHVEDRARVQEALEEARRTGADIEIEYRVVWPDGSIHWVAARGRCFRDEDGQVAIISGTCQDISDRKRAEESLAFLARAGDVLSSSLRYEETMTSLARLLVPFLADWCAVYVERDDTIERVTVAHANPEKTDLAERYLHSFPVDPDAPYGPAEVIRTGRPSYMFEGPPPLPPEGPSEQRRLQEELGFRSIIIVPLTARGRTIGAISLGMGDSGRTYNESDLRLAQEIGSRAGLAVDNALLFEQSEQSQAELRRSNEAKDEFLGILAHEIRSPTTTLYGTVRILRSRRKALDDETIDELLQGMEEQSERLNRLISDLLVIARAELGRDIPRERTDVVALLERTVAEYVRRRPSRAVKLDVAGDLRPADLAPTYLEQVVRNLIENADKYSPADQPITVTLRPQNAGLTVRVLDRGPGISPEELNLVFESFYRSSQTASQTVGKGLGLTVCKRLVEAQGGRIWARNRRGGGLEVGFWLPLQAPPAKAPAEPPGASAHP